MVGAIEPLWSLGWFSRREQVLPQRGTTFASSYRAQRRQRLGCGVHDRHLWPPLRYPQKFPLCRGNVLKCQGPKPLGAQMSSSGFPRREQVLPRGGHRLRRQLAGAEAPAGPLRESILRNPLLWGGARHLPRTRCACANRSPGPQSRTESAAYGGGRRAALSSWLRVLAVSPTCLRPCTDDKGASACERQS
jgi:hypothetical protein